MFRKLYYLTCKPQVFERSVLRSPRLVCGFFLCGLMFLTLGMMLIFTRFPAPWNGILFLAFIIAIAALISLWSMVSTQDMASALRYLRGDEQGFWRFNKD